MGGKKHLNREKLKENGNKGFWGALLLQETTPIDMKKKSIPMENREFRQDSG